MQLDGAAKVKLEPGDRIPSFKTSSRANPTFSFDSVAGRWLVLGCLGSLGWPQIAHSMRAMTAAIDLFDDRQASLFLLSADPKDKQQDRVPDRLPGLRVLLDTNLTVSKTLGAVGNDATTANDYRPFWIVMDPGLTIRAVVPLSADAREVAQILTMLRNAPPPESYLGFPVPPPVLILPDVFEPAFCSHLIDLYHRNGAEVSGFMRDVDGKTLAVHDPSFKVRRDFVIDDPTIIKATQARIMRKVIPQIERVHFFRCSRMERYMVGGYPADEGGHFRPHRDNTTLGTAHRRFAVSINLNDDFEGGAVSFPEYSPHGIKAPRGAAVVFSCSLLHAVGQVTCGTRYAFLPFLYDDAAAKLREANAAQVPNAAGYKA